MYKFKVGVDGRTAYERITKHRCKHFIVGFGEQVHFKTETIKTKRHKVDTEFAVGIFVGYVWNTTEYIVINELGAFRCRTIRRMTEENAYDPECVAKVQIRYGSYIADGLKSISKCAYG